ncbi:cysteine hydrolase [Jeongeupia naejangsanensis]|uniref:Cysteine hydrolase n=1 Tax=Jeongeupia naejangsanensis TaxID=613195 RepID=A0ABS2BH56_9NEIS|nr:cysteine hydrolase [Jeongeupia naejangsanensis]MBM3114931.1 cysteine hydrolase [Jeongeupia naejangsanensis]
MRTQLLIIDPQNDFCDLPATFCPADPLAADKRLAPALPVAGAHADMLRLGRLIDALGGRLDAITITLDSHQRLDIGHPTFWKQDDGSPVAPFTAISAAEVENKRYRPRDTAATTRVLAYLRELEAKGRYTHMVWPVHCEIGSWGHAVHAGLRAAYNRWEERELKIVAKVVKGTNPWTEHYSAVEAEVPLADDASTGTNAALVAMLDAADTILIGGEAGSHCVKATTEHLVAHLPDGAARLILLTDCMSAVGGFEAQYRDFLADMQARGARLATSEQIAAECMA